MNTTIGKSFGLALLMVMGVIVTMLALGMFSSKPASAVIPQAEEIAVVKALPVPDGIDSNAKYVSSDAMVVFSTDIPDQWGMITSGITFSGIIDNDPGPASNVITITIDDNGPSEVPRSILGPSQVVDQNGNDPWITMFSGTSGGLTFTVTIDNTSSAALSSPSSGMTGGVADANYLVDDTVGSSPDRNLLTKGTRPPSVVNITIVVPMAQGVWTWGTKTTLGKRTLEGTGTMPYL